MSRSNHNGCGHTCGVCKPHKKWPSKGDPLPAIRRRLQDKADTTLDAVDLELSESHWCDPTDG